MMWESHSHWERLRCLLLFLYFKSAFNLSTLHLYICLVWFTHASSFSHFSLQSLPPLDLFSVPLPADKRREMQQTWVSVLSSECWPLSWCLSVQRQTGQNCIEHLSEENHNRSVNTYYKRNFETFAVSKYLRSPLLRWYRYWIFGIEIVSLPQ